MLSKIRGKLGFGCMRLPMVGGEISLPEFSKMVDLFMERGFNYFDTAHGYIDEKSESAIKECLCMRYDRSSFVLTNKLTGSYFKSKEDIRPLFNKQLEACGVDYFDFYLMHSQSKEAYVKFKACDAYEVAKELRAEGRVKHLGISFHDTAEVLDEILTREPWIEVVQLQINYADFESPSVQSRLCYEVARRHGKPIIVMEPVKGGNLARLPDEARGVLDAIGNGSPASYAIRFAAGLDGVISVLSGMSNVGMVEENTAFMRDFKPLSTDEVQTIDKVRKILDESNLISCTACRYCTPECPVGMKIPDIFSCYNGKRLWGDWSGEFYYEIHTANSAKASDCIGCGACEKICPQKLPIRAHLSEVAREFDKRK